MSEQLKRISQFPKVCFYRLVRRCFGVPPYLFVYVKVKKNIENCVIEIIVNILSFLFSTVRYFFKSKSSNQSNRYPRLDPWSENCSVSCMTQSFKIVIDYA